MNNRSPLIDRAFIAGWTTLAGELYSRKVLDPEIELPELNIIMDEWKARQDDLMEILECEDGTKIEVSHP